MRRGHIFITITDRAHTKLDLIYAVRPGSSSPLDVTPGPAEVGPANGAVARPGATRQDAVPLTIMASHNIIVSRLAATRDTTNSRDNTTAIIL
jgi:hypothetical protein